MPVKFKCRMKTFRAIKVSIIDNNFILFLSLVILVLTAFHSLIKMSPLLWGFPKYVSSVSEPRHIYMNILVFVLLLRFHFLFRFFHCDYKPYLNHPYSFSGNVDTSTSLPDIVHYIRFGFAAKCFKEDEVKALLSVINNHHPSEIYIHTNDVGSVEEAVSKITRNYTLNTPITVKYYPQPKHVFGLPFNKHNLLEHAVDFTKLKILRRYGGIFLDNNVHLIRSLKKYLNFEMTVVLCPRLNYDFPVDLKDDVVIAHRDARFLHLWLRTYHEYDEKETKHTLSSTMRTLLQKNELLVKKMKYDLPEMLFSKDNPLKKFINKSHYFVKLSKDNTQCVI